MTQKTSKPNQAEKSRVDEHKAPSKKNSEREDFQWLDELRETLSPYWSSRIGNHPEQKGPFLILEGAERRTR